MKALSIIGIVFSVFSGLFSIAVMDVGCYSEYGSSRPGEALGGILLLSSLYFLAFSITATVKSFKKKKTED